MAEESPGGDQVRLMRRQYSIMPIYMGMVVIAGLIARVEGEMGGRVKVGLALFGLIGMVLPIYSHVRIPEGSRDLLNRILLSLTFVGGLGGFMLSTLVQDVSVRLLMAGGAVLVAYLHASQP